MPILIGIIGMTHKGLAFETGLTCRNSVSVCTVHFLANKPKGVTHK